MFHNLFKEVYFLPVLFPVADLGSTIVPSTYIDVSQFDRFGFILIWGVTDRTTLTIQMLQATSSAGAGSKALATDLKNTSPGALDDNKWCAIEAGDDQLDINNGFRYVAVQPAVAGGSGALSCVIFYGFRARSLSVTQVATAAGSAGPGMFEYKIQ
jgi:hypothetical protein